MRTALEAATTYDIPTTGVEVLQFGPNLEAWQPRTLTALDTRSSRGPVSPGPI